MKKVFVSGCYDVLHAGHVQFFEDARALGDHLTVCFASDEVLMLTKKRRPSIPEDNKRILIASLRPVDEVVMSSNLDPVFDFADHIDRIKPDILAVTEDDKNKAAKKEFCEKRGMAFVVLPKRNQAQQISTTQILASIKNIIQVPLRVDFGGGWLDVPKLARAGAYIVNCSISPLVSLSNWPYERGAGLGGSAAYAILQAKSGVNAEIDIGVGWQDPAVISETGLCVWRSGEKPILEAKFNPDWLTGKMLILWTGKNHTTPDYVSFPRDYDKLVEAGALARQAAYGEDIAILARGVQKNYEVQQGEGMHPLPEIPGSLAKKYLGGGHGGYALYLFKTKAERDMAIQKTSDASAVQPYLKGID
jgi:cytidyltransferase-like protein